MSLQQLCNLLQKIEDTPGKNDKQDLLKNADPAIVPMLKEYLSISMDWFRIYGLGEKAMSKYEGTSKHQNTDIYVPRYEHTWEGFKELVHDLENRESGVGEEMKLNIEFFLRGFDQSISKWFKRALLKTITIGVSEKTVNKIWPKLINFFEVQLADSLEDLATLKLPETGKSTSVAFNVEPKLDGIRAVCFVDVKANKVQFRSRGGQPLYSTPEAGIDEYILNMCRTKATGNVVFDGELYTGSFNETQGVTSREDSTKTDPEAITKLRYYVFDMLTREEWDNQQCTRKLYERRNAIPFSGMSFCKGKAVITTEDSVTTLEQFRKLNQKYLDDGLEGVMVKDPMGLYVFKRSKAWLKVKPSLTDDFEITDIIEGKGKHKGRMGAMVLQLDDGTTCEVGSGFDDAQRTEYWQRRPIGLYAEVKYKMLTPDKKLREPIFLRLRPDKRKVD